MSATVVSIDRRQAGNEVAVNPLDDTCYFLASCSDLLNMAHSGEECIPLHEHEYLGLRSHVAKLRSATVDDVGKCGLSAEELYSIGRLFLLQGPKVEDDVILTEKEFEELKFHGATLRGEPLAM